MCWIRLVLDHVLGWVGFGSCVGLGRVDFNHVFELVGFGSCVGIGWGWIMCWSRSSLDYVLE